MKNYPSFSLMNYIQPFELKCRLSEARMSMILCTMTGYELSIVPCFETAHVSPCRSTTFSMSNSEKKKTHYLWEQSYGSFIHEAMEENMIYGRKKPETSHIVTSPIIKEIVHEDSR